jgi:hypothetical protein
MRMKYPVIFLLFAGSFIQLKAQTEVMLGQPYKGQASLIIKNSPAQLSKLRQVKTYSNVTTVKLINFNDELPGLDSVFQHFQPLTRVEDLQFVNCNLLSLTSSLEKLSALKEIHVVKGSDYFENTLFSLLKNNQVKQLFFESVDAEINTDSLNLLPSLEAIHLSGSGFNTKPSYSYSLEVAGSKGAFLVKVYEYGGFIELTGNLYDKKRDDLVSDDTYRSNSFIKQPIPGIRINDTLYSFRSDEVASFNYYSGSKIRIDKNSFTYPNGSPYQGEVKIFYREFRNPVEIMLSGIPMMNTEGGKTNLFKSGGMYEINATDKDGKKLLAKNDTAVKIDFKLTDTSSSFKFYSLNSSGHWDVSNDTITYAGASSSSFNLKPWTEAVTEYYRFVRFRTGAVADTTKFEERYKSSKYFYTYRKDNLYFDKSDSAYEMHGGNTKFFGKNNITTKALYKVRYVKTTKDKEIIFKIVPNKKYLVIPDHIKAIAYKMIVYTGSLSPQEFKETFNRDLHCWDLRNLSMEGSLDLEIKTQNGFLKINGILVSLTDEGKYVVLPKATKTVNHDIKRSLEKEQRLFDRTGRFDPYNRNDINKDRHYQAGESDAFVYCKKFQNKEESKMNIIDWRKYLTEFTPPDVFSMQNNNDLGRALLKSGLGVKNIDCYLHSGQMEQILVNYPAMQLDSLARQYHAMLFKSINTSYPLVPNPVDNAFAGFYFKRNENYLIRFSNEGYMQVTKPEEVNQNKKENSINLRYTNTYFVKGMDSNDITRLIFQ